MSRILMRALVGGLVLFGLSACGATTNSLYDWNGYNRELLAYYKSPGEIDQFAEKLYEDIEKAELSGKVPPGLYAEYGYIVMQMGENDAAILFFTKERNMWPESQFLMDNVIRRLGGPGSALDSEESEENEDNADSTEGAGQ